MATAIGFFDRVEDAERVADLLLDRGFVRQEVEIITGDRGGLIEALADRGIPGEDAHLYTEGVRRGGALVTVQASDARAREAQERLLAAGAVNERARRTEWRQEPNSIADPPTIAPKAEPEPATVEPQKPRPDPLLDLEVDKGGT